MSAMERNRLRHPRILVLGRDPSTRHMMNCNGFQQSAILSVGQWQYATFYTEAAATAIAAVDVRTGEVVEEKESQGQREGESEGKQSVKRVVNIARRKLSTHPQTENMTDHNNYGDWEVLTLNGYEQAVDDGHNTISLGICEGDETVHVAFDAHCEGLKYGVSKPGVALAGERSAEGVKWTLDALGFSPVLAALPGMEEEEAEQGKGVLCEITYPRFLSVDGGELLFECRVGMAGSGSCVIFRYGPKSSKVGNESEDVVGGQRIQWAWRLVGRYLVGDSCSPYINGLSFEDAQEKEQGSGKGKIHVTWTNRHFISYDDPTGEAHKQQAGPNGPENNADLGYVFSGNGGWLWRNSIGEVVGDLNKGKTMGGVVSTAEEGLIAKIKRDSGIMNQEGQYVGADGRVHVLMRDTRLTGQCRWRHSWWDGGEEYWCTAIEGVAPTETGRRGKVGVDEMSGDVYFVLPGNVDESLTVGRRKQADGGKWAGYGEFDIIWIGYGYDGEPLLDERLLRQGRLSVMTRTAEERGEVVVLDFELDGLS